MATKEKPGCGAGLLDKAEKDHLSHYTAPHPESQESEAARFVACLNTNRLFTLERDRKYRFPPHSFGIMFAIANRLFSVFGLPLRWIEHKITEADGAVLLKVLELLIKQRQRKPLKAGECVR